jgi:hypothetical protein
MTSFKASTIDHGIDPIPAPSKVEVGVDPIAPKLSQDIGLETIPFLAFSLKDNEDMTIENI